MDKDQHVTIKKDDLQNLCTDVADLKPAICHGFSGKTKWMCMLTAKKSRYRNIRNWHCTKYPVLNLCPYDSKVIHKEDEF